MTNIIGIDPGITGGIAVLNLITGELISALDMPVEIAKAGKKRISAINLSDIIIKYNTVIAFVEQVGAMPGQGVSSMFNFGRSLGVIEGVLAGLRVPIRYVTPQKWKAHAGMIGSEKGFERTVATQIWPNCAHFFSKVKDSGRADAALIARYGQKTGVA